MEKNCPYCDCKNSHLDVSGGLNRESTVHLYECEGCGAEYNSYSGSLERDGGRWLKRDRDGEDVVTHMERETLKQAYDFIDYEEDCGGRI